LVLVLLPVLVSAYPAAVTMLCVKLAGAGAEAAAVLEKVFLAPKANTAPPLPPPWPTLPEFPLFDDATERVVAIDTILWSIAFGVGGALVVVVVCTW